MFEFSVSRGYEKIASPVKSMHYRKGGGNREGCSILMFNTNCQGIENWCGARYGGNNMKYNQTLNYIF